MKWRTYWVDTHLGLQSMTYGKIISAGSYVLLSWECMDVWFVVLDISSVLHVMSVSDEPEAEVSMFES